MWVSTPVWVSGATVLEAAATVLARETALTATPAWVTGTTILAAGATVAPAATVLSAASLKSVGMRRAVAVAMRVVAPVLMAPTKEDVASMLALEPVLAAVITLAAATSLAAASATV